MTEGVRSDCREFGAFRLYPRLRKLFCGADEVQLGGRAMDLLIVLSSKPGELATRDELLAAVWPNVYVHESNLKVTVASLRRALREFCPSDESINTVVGRGYWLRTDAPPEALPVEALSSVARAPLPQLGTVIGRDAAIGELREALARQRLTTIVGAGGMGKTTVAVAAAHIFEDTGGGAVTFVDLARVASEEFVTPSLATALGVSSGSGDRLEAIVSILSRRNVLLLFDTCEHVLDEVARICDVILSRTRDVRILATSRQVLGVPGEALLWLAPLEVPPPDHADRAEDVLRYSAPQLLVTRALEKSGYVLHDEDARPIAEICRRLDGAPLAIELISSRLTDRNAGATLEKLDDRFRTLRRLSPGGPLRQQTLLATLEWSYSLLAAEEASVLRAVSIFAGDFDAEDVIRVVAHLRLTSDQTRGAIGGLLAKSMVSPSGTSGETRYRLLDTTRAFASDLLDSLGELAAVSANHARLQLDALTRAVAPRTTRLAREGLATRSGQGDDLRKALDWALHQHNEPLLGIRLAAAGLQLWHELSLGEECRRHCKQALAEFERIGCTDAALKLQLVVGLASMNTFLSADPEATMALFETAIRLARETADASAECRALGALVMYEVLPGHEGAVNDLLEQMRQAALRSKEPSAVWEHEQLRAEWELNCCEFAASLQRLDRLRAELHAEPDGAVPRFQVDQRTNIETQYGALCWFMGKPGQAVHVIEQAAQQALETRHGLTLIHCFSRGIIFTMNECHLYAQARSYAKILRSAVDRHGMAAWIPIADCWSACIDALSGEVRSPQVVRTAFENLWRGSVQLGHQAYHATLARAMIALGQIDDAVRIIDLVFQAGVQRAVLPEFLRMRAATERAFARDEEARRTLERSVQVADEIGCLGWKLRSALDLATLLRDQGAVSDSRHALAPVYAQFSDGFDTGDLRNARALLESLDLADRRFAG